MGSFKSRAKILSGLYFSGMKITGLQVTIKVIFSCRLCFYLCFSRLAAYQYSVLNQFEHDPDDEMGDHDQVSCDNIIQITSSFIIARRPKGFYTS
jgi:hypothetical protein